MDCNWLFNIVYKGALGEERSKFLSYNIVENDAEISRVMRVVMAVLADTNRLFCEQYLYEDKDFIVDKDLFEKMIEILYRNNGISIYKIPVKDSK